MPEFILDTSGRVQIDGAPFQGATIAFANLDSFTQGYIEAMFFTDNAPNAPDVETFEAQCESGENEGSFHRDATFGDLAPEALAKIMADCKRFQTVNSGLLETASELEPGSESFRYGAESLDDRRLGQLFWYARNGHGVAFTDDGDADCLKALQEASRGFGGVWSCLGDDGLIYLS